MFKYSLLVWLFVFGLAGCGSHSNKPPAVPVAPPAVPITDTTKPSIDDGQKKKEAQELETAIAPYVAKSRESWPAAKKRFQDGLEPGHAFIVVAQLRDEAGASERAYLVVSSIEQGKIKGRIESNIASVKSYKTGDMVVVPESDFVDWIIRHPNGSEEGNVVGNFLDSRK